MTGPSWLMDSKRIATKIKSASGTTDPSRCKWLSNPTKACPRCNHIIDNSDVLQEWPGLPQGVKFDPSDSELLWHLQAKVAKGDTNPHPFINEFIPTVDEEDGICYTHPQKLPGVKKDGSVSHFFHKTFKAYNTGTRKRRKIHTDELGGDVRWHKTGKTKQVIVDGIHVGCKKIMVLYMNKVKGDKPEKTNWVMHQYHLGTEEDEKDNEFVVSKIFYQQQLKPGDNRSGEDLSTIMETMDVAPVTQLINPTVHYDSPTSTLPHQIANQHPPEIPDLEITDHEMTSNKKFNGCRNSEEVDDKDGHPTNEWWDGESLVRGDHEMTSNENFSGHRSSEEKIDDKDGHPPNEEDAKWWDGESQFLLDSQQLAEGIALCDEFLRSQSQSQSSYGAGGSDDKDKRSRPSLSDYARAGGVDDLKKDLEECQNLNLGCFVDPDTNIEQLDTHPDMRLSQLEFGSQDSFQFPA